MLSVASMYNFHKMHFDQAEALVKEALEELATRKPPAESDLYPTSPNLPNSRAMILSHKTNGLSILCELYQNQSKWDELAEALPKWRATLDEQKSAGFTQSYMENNWKSAYSRFWQKMAAVAEQRGRKIDALAYYFRAMDPIYISGTQPKFMTDMLLMKAKNLWVELGGSEEAMVEWIRRDDAPKRETATPSMVTMNKPPEEIKRALPPMTLKDVAGRSWTLADLKGKTTLINLWATWCGPCIKELPMLEKLYERVKDRSDVVVLTLNTDDNPGLIGPFLNENHYTFPVLPARDYVDSIVPSLSIPRNWIVDRDGVIAASTVGYNPNEGEAWIDKTIASLEKRGSEH